MKRIWMYLKAKWNALFQKQPDNRWKSHDMPEEEALRKRIEREK